MSEDGSFFSRWSQRKLQLRQGVVPPAEPPAAPLAPVAVPPAQAVAAGAAPLAPEPVVLESPPPPPPTLAEAQALTTESDFTRFVAPGVDSQVRNTALKTLFTDPHFNVMDGLDTYIDDYGKPDPLPEGMLRKMAQSQFLGLFTDEPVPAATDATPASPAAIVPLPIAPDEDTDLRLQPHDAAGCPGAEPCAEPDARREL
ncbi:DUF3306 domain-containing protein [Aquabacterium sp.]|uniref:DUF3306 domain-containing protein n=1 Tax=Aquabacterium sp. TaxID=1872578 RepID=UPI002BF6EA57|nr:DUF3306 domain-containing protein [Aquabacterium sp.]HSW07205.1 DUF3306 domain-containing protein [Aquabacterium sp.]